MKTYLLLIAMFTIPSFALSLPTELINFDEPLNESYLQKEKVLSARLNQKWNFWKGGNATSTFCIEDVLSNFSAHQSESFFIQVKHEKWVYDWLKEHRNLRIYFKLDAYSGTPELWGYSKQRIALQVNPKFKGKLPKNFTNFAEADPANIPEGKYVLGSLAPEQLNVYKLAFKQVLLLIYPQDLKVRQLDLYGAYYELSEPVSVALAQALVKSKSYDIVLEKLKNGKYKICGYVAP